MANLLKLVAFLQRFSAAAGHSRWLSVLVVAAGIIAGLVSTSLLAATNAMLSNREEQSPALAWQFAALCLALPLARTTSQLLLVRLAQSITFDLRLRMCRKILAAPLRRLEDLSPSRLLATLTDDVNIIAGALTNVPLLFLHATVVLSSLVYMGWLSWRLLLVVLFTICLGIASYQIPLLRGMRHFRLSRELWDEVFQGFRGLTEGIKELKIHRPRRHAFLAQQLEPAAAALRHHNVVAGTIYAFVGSWGQSLFFVLIGLLLFVIPQWTPIDQATLSGYTLAVMYMLTPLDVLLSMVPNLGRAVVAIDKVEELGFSLDAGEVERPVTADLPALTSAWSRLELSAVSHTYCRDDDGAFIVGPVNIVLTPGDLIFLVGGNGSGKTTLAKLLMGLYAPESGEILLDGRRIGDEERDAYRQLFSVVFSDFFLFEALLGLEGERLDDRAKSYLERLHLARKVRVENGELSTIALSQGQRKRLALLTAYLEDRPIYLFDEWAADQDPEFKEIFYRCLLPELKSRGKTVCVISHDDRYYEIADRIIKLENGRIDYNGPAADFLKARQPQPVTPLIC